MTKVVRPNTLIVGKNSICVEKMTVPPKTWGEIYYILLNETLQNI